MAEVSRRVDDNPRRPGHITKAEAMQMQAAGDSLWGRIDRLPVQKKRTKTLAGLKKFEAATGINTSHHRAELERYGEDGGMIEEKLRRIKKGGTNYYQKLLERSGAFTADGRLGDILDSEKRDLVKYFATLDISEGDPNMIDVLTNIEKMLSAKKEFMERYKEQTPYVKKEFDRLLPTLGLIGSKEELLKKIIKSIGEMEKAPSAVQRAFKEKSKSASTGKQTEKLKTEVLDEYNTLVSKYENELQKNMNVFGGEVKNGWSLTAREFRDEFRKCESLAEMKDWMSKLPGYIKERRDLYKKRDQILENASPADKKKFERVTKKMRRHQLEKYLKDTLEPAIRTNNPMVAEYTGKLIIARVEPYGLFSTFEQAQMKTMFVTASPEDQKALLRVQRLETKTRRRMVKNYMALPQDGQDYQAFSRANNLDRIQMLQDAKAEYYSTEMPDPFDDIRQDDDIDHLSDENILDMTRGLDTQAGEKLMKDALKKNQQNAEATRQAVDVQKDVWGRVKHHLRDAAQKDLSLEDAFSRDLATWTRTPKHLLNTSLDQAPSERMENKMIFHDQAEALYRDGYVTHSAGTLHERQDITDQDLIKGRVKAREKAFTKADYATDINFMMEDGRELRNGVKFFERIVATTIHRFMPKIMEEILKSLGVSKSAGAGFLSNKKAESAAKDLVTDELGIDKELLNETH